MRIQTQAPPVMFPNKTSNSVSVRGTAAVVSVIERLIRANDKPRAEVIVDVQILEVNRRRLKQCGIDLNACALNLIFLLKLRRRTRRRLGCGIAESAAVQSEYHFARYQHRRLYLGVPTAVLRFIEQDSNTRVLAAAAAWRGGRSMTLNSVRRFPSSVRFGAAVQGGCQHPAIVLHVSSGRREHGNDAACDLRRRDHPRVERREQRAGCTDRRRRPVGALLHLAQSHHQAASEGRRIESPRGAHC
jgi:hypothetical protein